MTRRKPLTDVQGEVRELTKADLKRFRPAAKVLPPALSEKLARHRGRPKSPAPKIALNIRLSPDVLAYFKAKGKGWQTRIDLALRKAAGL